MSILVIIFFVTIAFIVEKIIIRYEIKSNIDLFYDLYRADIIRTINKYKKED